jgi:hypothetical protein
LVGEKFRARWPEQAAKIREMARRGRPRLLTPALVERVAEAVEAGDSLELAARNVGVGARSLRRWRAQGRPELAGLSAEAQLELRLGRAARRPAPSERSWREAVLLLEAEFPERWGDRSFG